MRAENSFQTILKWKKFECSMNEIILCCEHLFLQGPPMASEIIWHGAELEAKIKAAAQRGCHMAAEKIVLPAWAKTIPWATGDLASHLTVTDTEEGAIVSSSGPYALKQELDETLRHPDPTNPLSRSGRTAHAGRNALNQNQEKIREEVQKAVNSVL
jgi:hypothetical protein